MEKLALELQSHIRQLEIAMEYLSNRLHGSPTVNGQDVSTCAAAMQHLTGALELCEVLVSHSEMMGPWVGRIKG